MRITKALLLMLTVLLLGVGGYLLAQGEEEKSPAEAPAEEAALPAGAAPAPPPPGVTYVTVSATDQPVRYERLAVVEPSRNADVRARVQGFLAERLFEEGQHVEEGQALYRIERDGFEATVQMRQAELTDAKARLDLANREYERTQNLSRTGAIAQERLDTTEVERQRATAAVARAEASLREAELDLSYTEVTAPVSGIVGMATRDRGDLVDSSSNSLLTTITRVAPIYVTYGISEADYFKLQRAGNRNLAEGVEFRVLGPDGEPLPESGTLNFQSPQFEPSTGMLRVRIEFPNENRRLLPNQFVKLIEDHGIAPDVVMVPKKSVIQSPAGAAVFVIDDENMLQFRPVTLGEWKGDLWEIRSGLSEGERVMVQGLLKSRPGSPVTPSPYEAIASAK